MTRLYLIRHGQTEWNAQKRTQGCGNNIPLSLSGTKQAKLTALRFKYANIDAIYSSDLQRAVETAQEIGNVLSKVVIPNPNLCEMNLGCWEGLTFDEINEKYFTLYNTWSTAPGDAIIPEGETIGSLKKRVINTVYDILQKHNGKNIIIVSHGITIKVLILSLLGMDSPNHHRIHIDNAAINIIDFNADGHAFLTLLNDTCHLEG